MKAVHACNICAFVRSNPDNLKTRLCFVDPPQMVLVAGPGGPTAVPIRPVVLPDDFCSRWADNPFDN